MFEWNQFSLQDALSPIGEEFLIFHDYLIVVLVFILTGVLYYLVALFLPTFTHQGLLEGQSLELVWTLFPAIILVAIAIPSLTLLYRLERTSRAILRIKVVGHQWYWSYEYTDFWRGDSQEGLRFDSYMVPAEELQGGEFRLLETDNRPVLPFLRNIRVLVRSADVLHSWAVPSLRVKLDATPGRLNQTLLIRHRPGLAYGQCSEICGANHSFMPIRLEFVNIEDFLAWVELIGDE